MVGEPGNQTADIMFFDYTCINLRNPMDNTGPVKDSIGLPIDAIVGLIRDHRNAVIKGFLLNENLLEYFKHHYNRDLSPIKIEFLKKDLKQFLISPVDLVHYSGLIKEIRETNRTSLDAKGEHLIYGELEIIFKKYCY